MVRIKTLCHPRPDQADQIKGALILQNLANQRARFTDLAVSINWGILSFWCPYNKGSTCLYEDTLIFGNFHGCSLAVPKMAASKGSYIRTLGPI